MAEVLQIDNTKRSTYTACPRKYQIAHIYGMKSDTGSTALRYGSAWHGLMEGYYEDIIKHGWGTETSIHRAVQLGRIAWDAETVLCPKWYDDYRTFENACAAFTQYIGHFASDRTNFKVQSTEQLFKLPLILTDVEKQLFPLCAEHGVEFTGKLDLLCKLSGAHYIVEFKTTGQPLALQLNRLHRTPQLIGYNYAAHELGFPCDGNLISMHHISSRKKADGEYGKLNMGFERQIEIYTKQDLLDWRLSFLYTCESILRSMATGLFPMHLDSCYQYGPCTYIPICSQGRPMDEVHWEGYHEQFWNVLETGHEV